MNPASHTNGLYRKNVDAPKQNPRPPTCAPKEHNACRWGNIKMKPIEIKIHGYTQKSSQEICEEFLDTERWSEFKGYSILPGIEHAHFEKKTPGLVGARIKVQNKDGSSHVEEIIEWDTANKVALRFQEFSSPLQHLATHFIETWEFRKSANGTEMSRTMSMVPKGIFGWLMLIPISKLMKKSFEKNLIQTGGISGKKKPPQRIRCEFCGEMGHEEKDCPNAGKYRLFGDRE
jgi:hypothetical protein